MHRINRITRIHHDLRAARRSTGRLSNTRHTGHIGHGDDGLAAIRRLIAESVLRLNPDGLLVFEFGFGQDMDVERLIEATPELTLIDLRRDLLGIARTAVTGKVQSTQYKGHS